MTSFLCLRAHPRDAAMRKHSLKGNLRLRGLCDASWIRDGHALHAGCLVFVVHVCGVSLLLRACMRAWLGGSAGAYLILFLVPPSQRVCPQAPAVEDESFRIKSSSTGLSLAVRIISGLLSPDSAKPGVEQHCMRVLRARGK